MHGQNESLDAAALTPIIFAAIYLYIRVTVVWIVSLASRYAERATQEARRSERR